MKILQAPEGYVYTQAKTTKVRLFLLKLILKNDDEINNWILMSKEDIKRSKEIKLKLNDNTAFILAMEAYFAENGTGIIHDISVERRSMRAELDSLGKVILTEEGDGSMENPYKVWSPGKEVHVGEWWKTEDGFFWEAIKDGIPSSSEDKEYWDIPE